MLPWSSQRLLENGFNDVSVIKKIIERWFNNIVNTIKIVMWRDVTMVTGSTLIMADWHLLTQPTESPVGQTINCMECLFSKK